MADTLQDVAEELTDVSRALEFVGGRRDLHGDGAVASEAGVDLEEFVQAAQQQAGPDHQNHDHRDLGDDQEPAHANSPFGLGAAAASQLELALQITTPGAPCRCEAEDESG